MCSTTPTEAGGYHMCGGSLPGSNKSQERAQQPAATQVDLQQPAATQVDLQQPAATQLDLEQPAATQLDFQ